MFPYSKECPPGWKCVSSKDCLGRAFWLSEFTNYNGVYRPVHGYANSAI